MMFSPQKFLLVIITLAITINANAIIIGDKDWLQVTATTGYSWNSFDAVFDTSTGECDVTGCLVSNSSSSAINLTGYTWANNNDVNNLFISEFGLGLNSLTSSNSVRIGVDGAEDFIPHTFSPTFVHATVEEVYGLTRESNGDSTQADYMIVSSWVGSVDANQDIIYLNTGTSRSVENRIIGGWFYRTVPEPSLLALLSMGLIGMYVVRRRRAH